MTLVLVGITALFLGFSAAYLYNRVTEGIPPVQLPALFYFNTLILVGCSLVMRWTRQKYQQDDTEKYKIGLWIVLISSIAFLGLQILAWIQLTNSDVLLTQDNMASYLYVISALHFLHVVAGIPFLIHFIVIAIKKMKTPVSVLIYFSDPDKKRRLNLLLTYWHYLDFLWIYLMLFFSINLLV